MASLHQPPIRITPALLLCILVLVFAQDAQVCPAATLPLPLTSTATTAIHVITTTSISRTFQLTTNMGEECPTKVIHSVTTLSSVPHAEILMDGAKCTSDGSLNLIDSTDPSALQKATALGASSPLLQVVLSRNSKGSYIGIDTSHRVCGSKSLSAATVSAFVDDGPVTLAPGVQVPARGLFMVIDDPNKAGLCVYAAPVDQQRNVEPGQGANSGNGSGTNSPGTKTPQNPGTTTSTETGGTSTVTSDPECFAADATVELRDGTFIRMDGLQIGHVVRVASGRQEDSFSRVYAFTHSDKNAISKFVRVVADSGTVVLNATEGHFVYANGKAVEAGKLRVGDALDTADGRVVQIEKIERTLKKGLYNPQTVHGDIVVDGVLTSTYTKAVHPAAAHALLAPVRAACEALRAKCEQPAWVEHVIRATVASV